MAETQNVEMRNVTCAACELAQDCNYARKIRDEWILNHAKEHSRIEVGCVLPRGEIEDLLRNHLGCPIAYEAFLLDFRTHSPVPWATVDPIRLQQWITPYVRSWKADLQLLQADAELILALEASFGSPEEFFARVKEDLPRFRVKMAFYHYFLKMNSKILQTERLRTLLEGNPVAAAIWKDVGTSITEEKVCIIWDHARHQGNPRQIFGSIATDEYYTFLRNYAADTAENRDKIMEFGICKSYRVIW